MKFEWIDYSADHAPTVEPWLDAEAIKYTGCDDGWDDYCRYWKSLPEHSGKFHAKLILHDGKPFAVMAMGHYDGLLTVSEFIVSPSMRGKGYGTEALRELLRFGKDIVGFDITDASAVIFPDNIASQKAFSDAGFEFDRSHPDGDALYYVYMKPRAFRIHEKNVNKCNQTEK